MENLNKFDQMKIDLIIRMVNHPNFVENIKKLDVRNFNHYELVKRLHKDYVGDTIQKEGNE